MLQGREMVFGGALAALLFGAACQRAATTSPERPGSTIDGGTPRFNPAVLDGAACEIRIDTPWMSSTEAYAFTPSWHSEQHSLRLRVSRAAIGFAFEGVKILVVTEQDRIDELRGGKIVRTRRAIDDADTAKMIRDLTGAAHVFLELDAANMLAGFSDDFEVETPASLLGVRWFAGMPILPDDVAVGSSWIAERPFPAPRPVLEPSVAIKYRVRKVADGIATIELETAAAQRKRKQPAASWHLEGKARMRVRDGMFLDGDVEVSLGDETAPIHLRWMIRSQCVPVTQ